MAANISSNTNELRALRIKDVEDKIGVKRSTLYDWMNPNSSRYDPSFPRPIKLSRSSVAWLSNTLDDWLLAKYRQQVEGSVQ